MKIQRLLLPALASGLLLSAPLSAQGYDSEDFACIYGTDSRSMTLFVGSQIVRFRSSLPWSGNHLRTHARTKFGTKVQSLLSGDDRRQTASFEFIAALNGTRAEAAQWCGERISYWRQRDYDVFIVDVPPLADEGLQVATYSTFTWPEYSYYNPGFIAAKAARIARAQGGSGAGSQSQSGSSAQRDRENLELRRLSAQKAARTRILADSLYDAGDYARAKVAYNDLLWIMEEYQPHHEHARERLMRIEQRETVEGWQEFHRETGLSFGMSVSQSWLKPDGALLGLNVARSFTEGQVTFVGGHIPFELLSALARPDSVQSEHAGEETSQYALSIGSTVPYLRIGQLGMHIGYMRQVTTDRALNLGFVGLNLMNLEGSLLRLDVTFVNGEPQYGGGYNIVF
jgi:hypothetical protein